MTRIARPYRGRAHLDRFWRRGVAAAFLAITCLFATAPLASAETRTLKLLFVHTGEKAEIAYKKNGRFLPSGLKKINHILRDWRRNEPTKMDPRLLDLVWEVYHSVGARDYIHVVSGYRSPATNSMLRKRSRGVAKKSQHMLGKAMDFFIPGVKLSKLRAAGLRAQGGGVGYYPRSGSPFVHLDVGNVRHWPRMSRSELAAIFPNGKTLHVPTDGKPLPGYNQALAAYKKRGGTAIAMASEDSVKRSGGFLSAFFGGGADDEEDSSVGPSRDAPPQARPRPEREVEVARAEPPEPEKPAKAAEPAKPEIVDAPFPPALAAPEETQSAEQLVAALPLRDVPRPMFAPRPSVDIGPAPAIPEIAAAEAAAEPAGELVADGSVPVPMWRPERPTAVAAADAPAPVTAIAEAPEARAGELAIEDLLTREAAARPAKGVPAPVFRPEPPVVLASLGGAPIDESAAKAAEKAGRVAMLGKKPPAPRDAVRWREGGADPVAALSSGVVTTPKSAKPVASDSKPDPRPVSVQPESEVVHWALTGGGEELSAKPDGKAFAFNSLRSAPTVVYTAGFQAGGAAPEANRFTGKAVTFLSVAKFKAD